MTTFRIQERAASRLDEVYRYTASQCDTSQAELYIKGLFKSFEQIRINPSLSRPIPAEFGVDGYFYRCQKHFVYWKRLAEGDIGIVTILHQRMHQIDRFRDDFGEKNRP
jgi:plasmid stabilization system protein ParE